MSIIYCITNTINGKKYIGQTIRSLKRRWSQHKSDAKKKDYLFARALKKYPEEHLWIKEVIEKINSQDLLNDREKYWISYYDTMKSGYNSTEGGDKETVVSNEMREKCSRANKGRRRTEEFRERNRLSHLGQIAWNKGKSNIYSEETLIKMSKPKSEDHKEKLRQSHLGQIAWNKGKTNIYSEEMREKMRQARLGTKHSPETKEKMRQKALERSRLKNLSY